MRSVLFTLLSLVVLVGGFMLYVSSQPATNPIVAPVPVPIVAPEGIETTQPGGSPFGAGAGAWANTYDQTTGKLASRFRASKYQPRPDGTVHVEQPQVEFFDGRERLQFRLNGDDGDVVMPGSADQNKSDSRGMKFQSSAAAGLPNRGQIRGVKIDVFSQGETSAPLVITLNNVAFDNETFRIYTESFVGADGIRVAGDQVPVTLRGPDFDFDGTGLTIRWNEKDRILQSLEVAHGDKVVIRNADGFSPTGKAKLQPVAVVVATPATTLPAVPTVPQSPAASVTANVATPAAVPVKSPAYRATFFDGVKVYQADAEIASGDTLLVDFMMEQNDNAKAASTSASPSTKINAAQAAAQTNSATITPSAGPASAPAGATLTSSTNAKIEPPSTRPTEPPMVIRWNGKLTIYPIEGAVPAGVEVGQSIVTLIGSPVKVDRDGTSIRAASLAYRTKDTTVLLAESAKFPLSLNDAKGTRVLAKSIDFSTANRSATLRGPATAELPVNDSSRTRADDKPVLATVGWQDVCNVTFVGDDANEFQLRTADLNGGVKVDHPQLRLSSDALSIVMSPDSTGQAQLQQMTATGAVAADVKDEKGQTQSISAQKLTLATATDAAGKLYPNSLNADGDVKATDGKQTLVAGTLRTTLRAAVATTQASASGNPQVELERLVASNGVKVTGNDLSEATGADLTVTTESGQTKLLLRGDSNQAASVTDGRSTLTGPAINVDPATKIARVDGGGTLHLTQKANEGQATARPVDAVWSRGIVFDGLANLVTVDGDVRVKSIDPDGTTNSAAGKTLKLALADDPAATTRPARQAPANGATSPAGFDFLSGKVARSVQIEQDVKVGSELLSASGDLLRRVNLQSSVANYDLPGRRFEVAAPGQLLFEDRRPADAPAQSTTQKKESANAASPQLANRGATAFQWNDRLVYNQPSGSATLNGDVVIVHWPPEDQAADKWTLNADRVTAFLEKNGTPTAPKTGATDLDQSMRLNKVVAEGNLRFAARDVQFEASVVEYDPQTQIMTARGTTRSPATLAQGPGFNRGNFDSLVFNVRTNQLKVTGFRASVSR